MQHLDIAGQPVTPIALGCAQYGSQQSLDEAFAQLDRYVELGGRCLDTAHIYGAWAPDGINGGYGNSEVVIGRWLRSRGCRQDMVISSKGAHPDFATGAPALNPADLARHLQESLDHLQVDRIDIYWLHRDDPSVPMAEILGWLAEPLREGRIGAIGCSHWRPERMTEALALADSDGLPRIAASQIACSLARQAQTSVHNTYGEMLAMDDAMDAFHRRSGLPLFAFNSQAAGFFADKYDGLDFLAADFPKPGLAKTYASPANLARRQRAVELAAAYGVSTNQIALAWLLQQSYPTVAIIGPRTIDQLDDSMAATTCQLSPTDWQTLAADR